MSTSLESRTLLAFTAVAAGVHAGIAPEHLQEWPQLGGAFVAAAVALPAASVALSLDPAARAAAVGVGALLAALAGAYVLTRLTAVPLLALRLARVRPPTPTTSLQEVTG